VTRKISILPCPLKHIHTSFGVRPRDHYKTFLWLPSACTNPLRFHCSLFRAFIRHLRSIILRMLLATQFLQHLPEYLGDLDIITSVMLELANILVQKMNPWRACFSFLIHLRCNRGTHYRTCWWDATTSAMGNNPYVCHLEKDWKIRKKMRMVARPK
jgi:hypothetical protein